jgi:hypothetical protein
MKKLQPQRSPVFFLAGHNVVLHVKEPYKIQQQMIESENFVPEAFIIHQLQGENPLSMQGLVLHASKDKVLVPPFNWKDRANLDMLLSPEDEEGGDDDDWEDDDEEDWDEDDDEDWDEDDEEEWDEDDDEEEWDDDEDEDWDEDGEAE